MSETAPDRPRDYGIAPRGHRLHAAARLGRVRLEVADLERSIAYYTGVLGMRVLSRGEGTAALGAERGEQTLIALRERRGARPVPRRGLLGLYHFALLLPDRASLGRFLAHLESIGAYAGMSDHFVSEAIYLTDPDGLGIEVYADRPRTAWRAVGGQLEMTTIQLDTRDLLAAAGGAPWTGLPAGTTVGHVHLHVGDIAAAEAFYHEGLGLDKVVWNYPGALFLSAGGYHHHLGVNTWARGAASATEGDARLVDWEVVLPRAVDVAAAAASFARGGYAVRDEGGTAVVADPWGTTLRVVAADDSSR